MMKKGVFRSLFGLALYDHGERVYLARGESPLVVLRKIALFIAQKYLGG